MSRTTTSIRVTRKSNGRTADHRDDFPGVIRKLGMSFAVGVEGVPASICAKYYAGDPERITKAVWCTPESGIVVSPTFRDFRGPSKKLQNLFNKLGGETVRVTIHVKADDALICDADLTRIGEHEGITVAQVKRGDKAGQWRLTCDATCYEDAQLMFLLGECLCSVTDRCCGKVGDFDLYLACNGEGVHSNYAFTKPHGTRTVFPPVSYRF